MTFPHGETVTRRRAAVVTDPYSDHDTGLDWNSATEADIDGCGVALGGSVEPLLTAREAVDSDFDVFMPPNTDVIARDRLIIRGLECDVAGRPFDWMNPFTGWQPGLVVQAKIREG